MQVEQRKRVSAVDEFDQHLQRDDGDKVVNSLTYAFNILRDSLFSRLSDDVNLSFGLDSMLLPVRSDKISRAAKLEIEIYQVTVSSVAVRDGDFLDAEDDWYLRWLAQLRLGDESDNAMVIERAKSYLSLKRADRRLKFTNVLAEVLPQSRRAPLVLFRLFPLSVQIATALAFEDPLNAAEIRNRQVEFLPAIEDCQQCHGSLLENGEQCHVCGNPVWKTPWLNASDA